MCRRRPRHRKAARRRNLALPRSSATRGLATGSSKPAPDHCRFTAAGGSRACRSPEPGRRHRRRRPRKAPNLLCVSPDAPTPNGVAAVPGSAHSTSDTRSTRRPLPRSKKQVSETQASTTFNGSLKGGSSNGLHDGDGHRPNLAQSRRASIQSASSSISETGSGLMNGSLFKKGQRRRSAEMGRSLTLSP